MHACDVSLTGLTPGSLSIDMQNDAFVQKVRTPAQVPRKNIFYFSNGWDTLNRVVEILRVHLGLQSVPAVYNHSKRRHFGWPQILPRTCHRVPCVFLLYACLLGNAPANIFSSLTAYFMPFFFSLNHDSAQWLCVMPNLSLSTLDGEQHGPQEVWPIFHEQHHM